MDVGVLGSLVAADQMPAVIDGITDAIFKSALADGIRVFTPAEQKRRFNICLRIVKQLRGDVKWAVPRILDMLPRYLRCELDGVAWEPEKRAVWLANE